MRSVVTSGIQDKQDKFSLPKTAKCQIEMEQIHNDNIGIVSGCSRKTIGMADALVSKTPHIALTVRTADCVPVTLIDRENGVIGIAHCGWKGSLKNLTGKTISKMTELGADKKNIEVYLGPSIGSCCYNIYGPRLKQFESTFPEWNDFIEEWNDGKRLNLARLNYHQAIDAGISKYRVHYDIACTSCDKDRYYSYHRDKTDDRMISYVMMHER